MIVSAAQPHTSSRCLRLCEVYIGDTASLPFLDFLRQKLRPFVGSTAFTDGRQNAMLEDNADKAEHDDMSLSLEQRRALLESYFEAVCMQVGLIDPTNKRAD